MKKFLSFALAMVLCVGILSGCGTNYNAEESTVYVQKNGKIVSTDVEEFDTSAYDESALKAYIDDAIDSYASENGSGRVKLQSLNIEDNKATLIMVFSFLQALLQRLLQLAIHLMVILPAYLTERRQPVTPVSSRIRTASRSAS